MDIVEDSLTRETEEFELAASAPTLLRGIIERIGPAVLLPASPGEKGSRLKGWNKKSLADMADSAYLEQFRANCNISVLVGRPSGGLCSIDFDSDEAVALFLGVNPGMQETLRTRGSRGCNLWVRVVGPFPRLRKIKIKGSNPPAHVGEWRSDGGQTRMALRLALCF